jgi:hypothetical protein
MALFDGRPCAMPNGRNQSEAGATRRVERVVSGRAGPGNHLHAFRACHRTRRRAPERAGRQESAGGHAGGGGPPERARRRGGALARRHSSMSPDSASGGIVAQATRRQPARARLKATPALAGEPPICNERSPLGQIGSHSSSARAGSRTARDGLVAGRDWRPLLGLWRRAHLGPAGEDAAESLLSLARSRNESRARVGFMRNATSALLDPDGREWPAAAAVIVAAPAACLCARGLELAVRPASERCAVPRVASGERERPNRFVSRRCCCCCRRCRSRRCRRRRCCCCATRLVRAAREDTTARPTVRRRSSDNRPSDVTASHHRYLAEIGRRGSSPRRSLPRARRRDARRRRRGCRRPAQVNGQTGRGAIKSAAELSRSRASSPPDALARRRRALAGQWPAAGQGRGEGHSAAGRAHSTGPLLCNWPAGRRGGGGEPPASSACQCVRACAGRRGRGRGR